MNFIGKLVPSVELIKGEVTYTLKVGDTIESIVYSTPYEDVTLSQVTLVGIELVPARSMNRMGRIYDGIPTNHFHTDDLGNFKNAEDMFRVGYLLVQQTPTDEEEEAPKPEKIPVAKIVTITGTFENADGTQTVGVDLSQEDASVSTTLGEVTDGSSIVMGEGEVSEALNIDKGVTLTGANAGVAQNFKQEV